MPRNKSALAPLSDSDNNVFIVMMLSIVSVVSITLLDAMKKGEGARSAPSTLRRHRV